jgi:hypothetical protein
VSLTAGQRVDVTVALQSGYVRLVNRRSGRVLDVTGNGTADGVKIVQWTWSGGANQQWQLLSNPDGSVRLVNRNSGRLLNSQSGASQGTQLDQWQDTNSNNQWWKLTDTGDGYYRLVNVRTGLCADVESGSTSDGARVIGWPANTGTNQQWQIVDG